MGNKKEREKANKRAAKQIRKAINNTYESVKMAFEYKQACLSILKAVQELKLANTPKFASGGICNGPSISAGSDVTEKIRKEEEIKHFERLGIIPFEPFGVPEVLKGFDGVKELGRKAGYEKMGEPYPDKPDNPVEKNRELDPNEIVHECKQNDNTIRVFTEDGKVDEVWFADPIGTGWLVIGYEDLQEAIDKAESKMQGK